ncbi:MAG: phosphotransferase [Rhodobacteraceae bacterium]|nr:phosphotransferase [Paracoccaceae bacterium]
MTRHMPDLTPTLPPTALITALVDGHLPALGPVRLGRMHFPSGRAPHAQIDVDGQPWIAEWIGSAPAERVMAEAARLVRIGQATALRWDAASGLLFRQPGRDAKLPGLQLLTDLALAEETLSALGLKGPFRIDLAAHRLGRRAVLRIRHDGGTAFARLRSPTASAGQAAMTRHLALWQAVAGRTDLRLPKPMGTDRSLGLALYSALPGRALQLRGLRGFADIEAAAKALSAVQSTATDAPIWTVEDEIALLAQWQKRVETYFPDLGSVLRPMLVSLCHDLRALAPMAPVTCHRDLHEGQILLFRGQAGLLDFDTLSRGDPALDLGNLQAHLDLAGLREGRSFAAYVTAAERNFPHVPLSRIAVWRRAARLRLAMIWAFSAEPRAHLSALLEAEA